MQASDEQVTWQIEDGIARVLLNRPEKANAIGLVTARSMAKAIDAVLAAQPGVILMQARGRIFCAGGDIDEFMAAGDRLGELVDAILDILHPAFLRLCTAPIPVIAEVNGPIGGAGVGLALSADFVLASTAMKLRTGYSALGLSPDLGSSYFLARRAGAVRAQQMLMLREPVDAAQCLAWGLVDELHAPDKLPAAALALALKLSKASHTSLAAIKTLCAGLPARSLQEQLLQEQLHLRSCADAPNGKEGVTAFAARRPAHFSPDPPHSKN